jgi:NDP-sugar pyrophosphorylase family protein
MKAILFADRGGTELLPLTNKISVALLPVAAKSLIDYTLDALWESQIDEVIVVISAFAEEIEHHLGDGERWGLQFEYVRSSGQEEPASVLASLGSRLSDSEYLLIRGDVLRSLNINEFLNQAQAFESGQVVATIDGCQAGVCLIRQQSSPNPWQASDLLRFPLEFPPSLSLSLVNGGIELHRFENSDEVYAVAVSGNCSWLDSLEAYHQANLHVLAGQFPNLVVFARSVNEQLLVGCRSIVSENNVGLVGAFCRVDKKAALLGEVVLCDKVIVDRYAQLSRTVVLPGTYIGEAVELHNAIVWGRTLIQVDTGKVAQVDDHLLLDFRTECHVPFLAI